ncbi:membrane cofactor protein isoform X1 [Triplophysa rosa]|uniref:membrane cofactor protein isoform X1 n=2 Tax=Triplophysa rosa TaxID=992332 RepID=UPI002545FE5F|nr:membrane cofactor protein isoform X1 [Triplophysa rosa]
MTMANAKVWLLLLLHFALVSMGRADCPLPQLNGSVLLSERSILQNNFPDTSEAFLECLNGFQRESGSTSISCFNGEWSAVELKCKKVDCGQPKPSPHMTYIISEGTLFGSYTRPICQRGYYLEGSSYRQCLVTGWSGKSMCSLIICEKPAEIAHGKIVTQLHKEDVVMDDVIEYSCDASYVLDGNRFMRCNDDGEYDSPPPTCKAIECQVPEVKFGIQIEGNPPYSYKSEARFKCEPGHTMKGSDTAVCEENDWSAIPECVQEKSNAADTTAKQTTAGVTINTPTTNTILNKIKEEQLTVYSLNGVKTAVILISVFAIMIGGVLWLVHHRHKQRGSYNTGEGQWTKEEELLPFQKPRANNRTAPLA